VICTFLWLLGRGKEWKLRNDAIFERELRARINIEKQDK